MYPISAVHQPYKYFLISICILPTQPAGNAPPFKASSTAIVRRGCLNISLLFLVASDVQNEDSVVSLNQLRGLQERQHSPSQSPANRDKRMLRNNEPPPLPQVYGCQSGSNADMDVGNVSEYNEEVYEAEEEYSSCSTPERPLSFASGGGGSEPKTPPEDCSFYEDLLREDPDQCAPFIPPPLGDSQFLMSCVDMFSEADLKLDSDSLWNTDWEILDVENTGEMMEKNLSTPKFFPDEEGLPVLNSKEIEMSTPVPNLPLLQGNEVWFELDQCKEVSA